MSPDQFIIRGAAGLTRSNEECAGIVPSKVLSLNLFCSMWLSGARLLFLDFSACCWGCSTAWPLGRSRVPSPAVSLLVCSLTSSPPPEPILKPSLGPSLPAAMFSVAIPRSECILGALTQWLPTGTADQLSAQWPVGFPVFLTCFCASIWQA